MKKSHKTASKSGDTHPHGLSNSAVDSTQCKATAKSGNPCRAKATANGYCLLHSDPSKAAEMGRKGGQKNRHVYDAETSNAQPPESAGDVKSLLAEAMASKLGTTLGYLGTSLLKAFEVADFAERLRKIEERIGVQS